MLIDEAGQGQSSSPESLSGAFLYGAGGRACALAACFARLSLPLGGFVVTDLAKNWTNGEKELMGLRVISLADFVETQKDVSLLIASKYEEEMIAICKMHGINDAVPFYQALSILGVSLSYETLCPDAINRDAAALAALGAWEDNESRDKYRSLINLHFRPDKKHVPECEPEQYFSKKYLPTAFLDRVVDAGAYDGDTFEQFLGVCGGNFTSYFAFEPDPGNFLSLSNSPFAMDSRVRIYRAGLSDLAGSVKMLSFGGLGSFISNEGNVDINTVRLSDVFREREAITLIKMDIEGHEEQALAGAEELIRRCRPAMAIAVYHRIEHLWRIPLWVKNLDLGYSLRLGHHSQDHDESVCYAIPTV